MYPMNISARYENIFKPSFTTIWRKLRVYFRWYLIGFTHNIIVWRHSWPVAESILDVFLRETTDRTYVFHIISKPGVCIGCGWCSTSWNFNFMAYLALFRPMPVEQQRLPSYTWNQIARAWLETKLNSFLQFRFNSKAFQAFPSFYSLAKVRTPQAWFNKIWGLISADLW